MFRFLKTTLHGSRGIAAANPGVGLRDILAGRCPLCGNALAGHRAGMVASFAVAGKFDAALEEIRREFLAADVASLPRDPAPGRDAVQYWLLDCPVQNATQVLEVVSRIDVFAPDSADVFRDIARDRVGDLAGRVLRWAVL